MTRIRQIVFYMAISIVLNWGIMFLKSDAFLEFLYSNIILLLITLLAINTATISIVVTKLYELGKIRGVNFEKTIKEVKVSLIEQIILIAVASLLLIIYHSPVIKSSFQHHNIVCSTFLIAIFIYAIDILRDTGCAIFDISRVGTKDN